jgi:opacity protein-like surface antigen
MAAISTHALYLKAFSGIGYGKVHDLNAVEPGKSSIITEIETTDHSSLFGAAIGYNLTNLPLSFELQTMRLNQQSFKLANAYPNGYHETDTLKVKSDLYLLNSIYSFPAQHSFTPFVGAGIGLARNKIDGSFVQTDNSNWNDSWANNSKTNFAYALTAGIGYQLTDKFSTALAYQYVSLGKLYNDKNAVRQVLSADQFASNSLMLSLSYKL